MCVRVTYLWDFTDLICAATVSVAGKLWSMWGRISWRRFFDVDSQLSTAALDHWHYYSRPGIELRRRSFLGRVVCGRYVSSHAAVVV
jgi:hypothetical protein